MGVPIAVNGLTKSFGSSVIWEDVTLEIPTGEVSVMLGPSGTGKSVFLKSLIGLLRPRARLHPDRRHEHHRMLGQRAVRDPHSVRRAVPGRRAVRLDEHLRQHGLPAARAHEEVRERNPQDRDGEARHRGYAQRRAISSPVRSPAVCASAPAWPAPSCSTQDHSGRRAGLRPRPRPYGVPVAAADRHQRADRRHHPDRYPQHQHRPYGAGQHRHAVPQAPGHVRAPRGAVDQ